MRVLKIKPEIHKFNSFKEFALVYIVGKGYFVITNEFIFTPFMKELNLEADFMFQEKFGFGEPSDEMINAIMAEIRGKEYKRIIAIGGGSIIDISKLLVLKDSGNCVDLFERTVPLIKERELIIVPTTCGTGSEVTNLSIAEIKSKHTKMGLAADELLPEHAVLIPELVKGLPYKFFVTSSVDALIHAVESFVSPKSNPYTELFSIKAVELIIKGYMEIIEKGEEHRLEILEDFVIGANYAGVAFGNTGVGAVHALSYPLGGTYHVPHGEANYQFFIEVFKYYYKLNPTGKIKQINKLIADIIGVDESNVYEELGKLLNNLLSLKPLKEYGMKQEEIELFTDSVIKTQQRLLVNNYVPFERQDILNIYSSLY